MKLTSNDVQRRGEMLANRVRKNARQLRKWARRSGVSCYRLYDVDIPEVPLAVDWYEGNVHIAHYLRQDTDAQHNAPHGVDVLSHWARAVGEALSVEESRVFVKHRRRQRGKNQYDPLNRSGHRLVVSEAGLSFYVNLVDYLDTGLFLDHRLARARVRDSVAGRRFLNLFGYTGAFTVYAAAGGARSSTTVDLSRTYLDWARANLELNGFAGPQHRLERADIMQWLNDARGRRERYDFIVLDPPTFSNSKRMSGTLDIRRDHQRLIEGACALLAPGGGVLFSTNARRFRFSPTLESLAAVVETTAQTVPRDFRKRPHRSWYLELK